MIHVARLCRRPPMVSKTPGVDDKCQQAGKAAQSVFYVRFNLYYRFCFNVSLAWLRKFLGFDSTNEGLKLTRIPQ